MKKLLSILTSAAALTILAACGGGGGGDSAAAGAGAGGGAGAGTTPTSAASKYAGTWVGCKSQGPTTSQKTTLVFTPQAADIVAFTGSEVSYAAPACAGAAGKTDTFAGTATFSGTKTIGAETVDKVIVNEPGRPAEKQVSLVKGTGPIVLTMGREASDGGTVDAEGYPNTLQSDSFTKQ